MSFSMTTRSRPCSVLNPNLAGVGGWAEDKIQHRLCDKFRSLDLEQVPRVQRETKPQPDGSNRPRGTENWAGRNKPCVEAEPSIPVAPNRGHGASGHKNRNSRSERHYFRSRTDTEEENGPQQGGRPHDPDLRRPRTSGRPRHRPTPEEARLVRRVRTIRSLNLFGYGGTGKQPPRVPLLSCRR